MPDDVAEEVDINDANVPGWVKEGTEDVDIEIEGEDISAAQGGDFKDWVEPAKDVIFEITSAALNPYTPKTKTEWKSRSLKIYLKVDKSGVDGKGKYAGKVFFPNSAGNVFGLLVQVNRDAYDFTKNAKGKPTEWYAPKTGGAFAGYKEFLEALGFSTAPTPKNDKAFRASLVGRKVMGNIEKKHRQVFDEAKGDYIDIKDEFENEITAFRAVKPEVVAKTETAVA